MVYPDKLRKDAFDQASLALALIDGRGRLALWNPAFDALFRGLAGVGPERLSGSFFDFLAEREGMRLDFYAAEILLGGRVALSVESPILCADGSRKYLKLGLSRVEDPDFEPASEAAPTRFLLCALDDLTERENRERRLREAKDEAEKATQTKSLFLANMSHEIRTPIQTILGVVELLRETELDTEQSDYVNQVRFSADVLLTLINDILDFSKIEAGRLELETTSFELRAWVYQAVDLLAMEANHKGLEVIVDIDPSLPTHVRGDPGRLRQIIVNLIKNAIKFTKEGSVALMVSRVIAPSGPRMRFEIEDTGTGIPQATRERLFTAFFQGDPAQARKTGGTGLGLAISRSFVELMGGAIGVDPARSGQGSLFWFELPLEAAEGSSPPSSGPAAAGERLLVVDDHAGARDFAARSAASVGYRVTSSGSGEEALAELRRASEEGDPYLLCLIDQNMPRMDGWRLASEITGDTSINGARLILMAPLGSINADAKMKLLRWFNGYLSKPVKRAELLEALSRALSSEVDLEDADQEAEAAATKEEQKYSGEVLLAEDHEVNRELFTLLLDKLGCKVVTASDGVEALEIGSARRFDLVLMDIFMPRMSGYEASRALRDKGYKGPIIAVTASALQGEKEKCLEAGMNDILVKPFKKEDLAAVLAAYLPTAQAAAAGGLAAQSAPKSDAAPAAGSKGEPVVDSSVFDWAGVLDTFLGQAETVSKLLWRFTAKAEAQVGELAGALAAKDAAKFREISHSLKGASWNLSARKLGDAALLGENAGREGDMEAAAAALEAIRTAYADFAVAAAPHAKA